MEQEKCGLCPYDDKRYLLADISDEHPNPNTHAYGHCDLKAEEILVADHPELGAELVIKQVEERFKTRHANVIRRILNDNTMDEQKPDGVVEGELSNDQLLLAKRMADARPGGAIRMGEVIEKIIARGNLERPVSPPTRIPALHTPQRAGPSGLNAHLPPFCPRIDSSDEEEPERPVWPPRRPHLEFEYEDYEQDEDAEPTGLRRRKLVRRRAGSFIDAEARVDGSASDDELSVDENSDEDLNGFIVADDVEF